MLTLIDSVISSSVNIVVKARFAFDTFA